ncbi:hypothetical protein WJX73_001149 [Symbiochloris irregularis]|uniref:Uncharacterized protein n=1 Tax=Symbiochloris irregularis TaxID=706552 RepID=A0AAW1PQD6_9CHLO
MLLASAAPSVPKRIKTAPAPAPVLESAILMAPVPAPTPAPAPAPAPSQQYTGIGSLISTAPRYSCFWTIMSTLDYLDAQQQYMTGPTNQTWLVPSDEACKQGIRQLAINAGVTNPNNAYSNFLNFTQYIAVIPGITYSGPSTPAQIAANNLAQSIYTAHQMLISIDFTTNASETSYDESGNAELTDYVYFVDGLMAAGLPKGTMSLIADYEA